MKNLLQSNPLQQITIPELVELLKNFAGTSFAGLQTLTNARAKKTGNPFPEKTILKETDLLANLGFHYSNSLVNQAKRENVSTEFHVQRRVWGERIIGTPLVEHKGNFYLEAKCEKVFSSRLVDIYGDEISREDALPFLPVRKESSTQNRLEKKIILRDFRLDSIKKFAFDGKIFLVG